MANSTQQTAPYTAQFYRLSTLKQRLGVSGSTIWSWIKQGKFPRGIKISDNVTAWNAADVERWAAARITASHLSK
jgi:prophage regulatory protein